MTEPLEPQTVDRQLTRSVLEALETKDLHWVIKQARRELYNRHRAKWALKERVSASYGAMANFMAGVAWALACRTSLRDSKEHTPVGGKRPASGEMWLPAELLRALRLDIKEKGWSPLSAPTFTHFQAQFLGHANRRPTPLEGATEFRVRLARPVTAVMDMPMGVADRFGS